MTKKKSKINYEKIKKVLPYFLIGGGILGLVAVGYIDKNNSNTSLSLNVLSSDYSVSVDQISEMYVVADVSDAFNLASASSVASNYVSTSTLYESGQTTTGKLEKPTITNISVSRGVISYTVSEGESMESIASKYGVTTDQIRWSNGLKTTDISAGDLLYIPSVSGIVYTVKSGETAEGIAEKYGGTAAEIIALNDLEVSGVVEGARILIKDGSLPETERPEYVAPVRVYTYNYLGNTSERQDIEVLGYYYGMGGPYAGGQCTQWAWSKRPDIHEAAVAAGYRSLGNASSWARIAGAIGYNVDRNPSAGAIFQTSSGYYGHVGYVESVNDDGSIVVTEMNYGYTSYRVIRATIPASAVGNFWYIH